MIDLWKELIETRTQTTTWNLDYNLDIETIKELSEEIHRRSPSKQNRVRYEMHWLDWSNPELRNEIYEFCVSRNEEKLHYNPQVLANWIVVFTAKKYYYPEEETGHDKFTANLEVGLASHMLIHGAKVRGLETGFCKCFDYNYQNVDVIKKAFDLQDIDNLYLIVGVGKENKTYIDDTPLNDREETTLNLYTGERVSSYKGNGYKWQTEPKPDPADYIFYYNK
jgi:hypothetical protein